MRSNYKTLPIIGHDPVYYHRHHDKAKVFNVFRPEEGNKQWHTQYYIDTIRFTQVTVYVSLHVLFYTNTYFSPTNSLRVFVM